VENQLLQQRKVTVFNKRRERKIAWRKKIRVSNSITTTTTT